MKKINKTLILAFAILLFAIADSKAQVYASKIPVAPKYKQPKKPSKYHVWVSDDWLAGKKKYLYVQGHWAYPPTETSKWVDGFWRKEAKGYVRVNGHWDYGSVN